MRKKKGRKKGPAAGDRTDVDQVTFYKYDERPPGTAREVFSCGAESCSVELWEL